MRVSFWKQFILFFEKSSEIKGKLCKENSCSEYHKSYAELLRTATRHTKVCCKNDYLGYFWLKIKKRESVISSWKTNRNVIYQKTEIFWKPSSIQYIDMNSKHIETQGTSITLEFQSALASVGHLQDMHNLFYSFPPLCRHQNDITWLTMLRKVL